MIKVLPHQRRKEVFRLLIEHGPLSIRGLGACLYPPIEKKRLYEVMHRLKTKRFVVTRQYMSLGKSTVYFQITQEPKLLSKIASILETDLSILEQAHFKQMDALHSETCAVWKELLKHLFPTFKIYREHEFQQDERISNILQSRGEEQELRPDLMLLADERSGHGVVAVAIEVERTHKGQKRLIRKFKKYSTQSKLDGLIYVCETPSLSSRLRDVYLSKVLQDALRIKHYGNYFILFTDGALAQNVTEPAMFNAALENISVSSWLHQLTTHSLRTRRDTNFATAGV